MWTWSKHQLFAWWRSFSEWVSSKDACELCANERADYICVGCGKVICLMCESGYYSDAELCTKCRAEMTPEEEEADRKETATYMAQDCTCPGKCELDEAEHAFIAKYVGKEEEHAAS